MKDGLFGSGWCFRLDYNFVRGIDFCCDRLHQKYASASKCRFIHTQLDINNSNNNNVLFFRPDFPYGPP